MKVLGFTRYALTTCAAVALLAGCGGSQPPIGAPVAMPQSHNQRAKSFLYVGNAFGSGSTFVVYLLGGSKPLRQIKRDWNVYAIAIDPWGDVYTTDDRMPSWRPGSSPTHAAAARKALLAINDDADSPLAFDGSGNLYVDDRGASSESTKRAALKLPLLGPLDWTHNQRRCAGVR